MSALLRSTTNLAPQEAAFYLIDAKPIPVCHPIRHRRVRLLRHIHGRIVNLLPTLGTWSDCAASLPFALGINGSIMLADLSYQDQAKAAELAEQADMSL